MKTTPIIIGLIVLLGAGAAYYYTLQTPAQPTLQATPTAQNQLPAAPAEAPPMSGSEGRATYSGAVLAGTSAPLLDFNQTDYQAALQSDKLVVLYFYADWCPVCREEFPKMQAAFNQLTADDVVGFRVNFNDNQTDAAEKALARQHGIAYQHTKVFVKDGQQILKSPETWEQTRYLTEINQALAQ